METDAFSRALVLGVFLHRRRRSLLQELGIKQHSTAIQLSPF